MKRRSELSTCISIIVTITGFLCVRAGIIIWFVSIEPDKVRHLNPLPCGPLPVPLFIDDKIYFHPTKVRSVGSQVWGYLYDHDRLSLSNIETRYKPCFDGYSYLEKYCYVVLTLQISIQCCGYLHTWDRPSSLSCQYTQPCYMTATQMLDGHKASLIAGTAIAIVFQVRFYFHRSSRTLMEGC